MPEQEPSAEGPANISVRGGQGTQVGTGNVQYNHYGHRPPRDLTALSLHAAVAYIRQLTHDEAVDLFAQTRPDALADKLRLLLSSDESMVIKILADLNPCQAAELIGPLGSDFDWLVDLPDAATAIAQQALNLCWDHALGAGGIARAPQSPQGTSGYLQRYQQGRVYWCDSADAAYAVTDATAEVHLAIGGTAGELGFPDSGAVGDWKPATGTEGTWQSFAGGLILSSAHGTYAIRGQIGIAIKTNELDVDRLGFPVAAAEARRGVTRQPFEGGTVYASDAGTFAVRPEFDGLAFISVPISAEVSVPFVGTGRMQRFKNAAGCEIAIYASASTRACPVTGEWLALYDRLGGPASALGYPTSPSSIRVGGRSIQVFQHGTMYHQEGYGPLAVPAETVPLVGDHLGWPVSAEETIGGRDDDRIQRFENGIVTRRSGKLEMWLRPVPVGGPPAAITGAAPPA